MYHKVIIMGNLGRDPEMRYTPDGTPVTEFSVATNYRRKRPDGTQIDETTWFRVTAWRQLAELCNQYLSKGRQVFVEGRIKSDENGGPRVWTGNDGQPRASFEVTANTVKFLGGRGEGEVDSSVSLQEPPPAEIGEDEIPF